MISKKLTLCCIALILQFAFIKLIAQTNPVAFVGAKIIPIIGEPIENGVLIIQTGKITAVGSADLTKFSSDTEIIDVSSKVIMPGLVDTHSHIGEGEG
jgi:imidazolonepropionase-like amidohydrolase